MHDFIVDSHCHLDLIEEKGIKLSEILENCQKNKGAILQTICTKIDDVDKLLNYCNMNPQIYCSIGIHPCNVSTQKQIDANYLINLSKTNSKIIGIGETGLDFFHDLNFIELQKSIFLEHIKASRITQLPSIIHSRNADEQMAEILIAQQKIGYFPALLHCFSSTYQLAKIAIDLGIYISISGIATFKNAHELRETIKKIPLEFLLIETDSPYLAPDPFRGQVNQPSNTLLVAQIIADVKGLDLTKVIDQTTQNFLKIFTRVKI